MTDSRSAQELAAWIKQKYGGLDILINEDIEKEISATSSMQSETIRYQEKTKDALEEEKEWMRKVMCNESLYTDLCTTSGKSQNRNPFECKLKENFNLLQSRQQQGNLQGKVVKCSLDICRFFAPPALKNLSFFFFFGGGRLF
ncbi:hypothetical protein O6H91_03G000300 [Diphasiastrum complanatum]|uniref:Uncharacterized protein n=1 Tax=Diphasiastrum complanatum TaxID=34168 RepID=A0ACC2E2V8_DIPCM|nr:hypothetical protein O6H91_03G000300 [Diphasiastrum complanatum]